MTQLELAGLSIRDHVEVLIDDGWWRGIVKDKSTAPATDGNGFLTVEFPEGPAKTFAAMSPVTLRTFKVWDRHTQQWLINDCAHHK